VSSSVDGLVSGLSTSSVINQLMQVEAASQTRLKNKVSTARTAVDSYQSVNSKINALKSAGDTLGQLSTWRAITATSTSSSVTATALVGTAGIAGTTQFDVKSLAKSQVTTTKVAATGDIMSGSSLSIDVGPLNDSDPDKHKVSTVNVTTKTAKGVAEAINAAGIGVRATVITTGAGENILQLSGAKTGAASAFTISGLDAVNTPLNNVTAATDARLEIGGGEQDLNNDGYADGYVVTSTTNTFSNLMPGVSITVSKLEDGVTVAAASDVDGMASKMQALVDAANAALDEVGTQTAYDPETKKGSPLTGDFSVRQMSQTILSTISKGVIYDNPNYDKTQPTDVANGINLKTLNAGSYATYGIQLDRSGRLTFDASAFKTAYAADPTGIQKVGIGIGDVFEKLGDNLNTNLKSVITGRKSEIDSLNTQIDNWDVRLAAKRTALQKQYSDLEVALGKLKDQSNWLSGQLAGLS
jgi:flagellar hook-associated protein 2